MEAAVLPPAAAPVSVGKYELGRLLGRGSFAKVYYARAVTSGAAVAVKVIDKAAVPSSVRPRLLREISVMRLLHHPNIVRLHEVMATRSKIFLVMEIAGGGDLRSLLFRRRRLPEPVAARIFQQLVSAVCFCHAHGVAHRDLKLQNLLIDDAGDLKVADFGLSFLSEERGGNGISVLHTACGTPGYAAPEVLRERGYDGARADAWSCGVILYAMLAGHLPFDGANLALAYHKMNKRDYNFPAWFSPAATRVISGLLDPNIETRLPLAVLQKELTGGDGEAAGGGGAEGSSPCKAEVGPVNAFQIIALSPCLDLSVLFRQGKKTTAAAEALKILLGRVTGGGDRAGSGATALT